jgi:NADH-quinone oxidoreductase subunit C
MSETLAAIPGVEARVSHEETTLLAPAERILEVLTHLRDAERFVCFIDITAVDYPAREKRFEIVCSRPIRTRACG